MMDTNALRQCLGQFATGVTVVTCCDADGHPCGITANSFSSVSLDPPLVLWNIAKVSNSLEAFTEADFFAISVLAEEHVDLSLHFARSDHTQFNDIDYELSTDGVPLLPDTIAQFECRTHEIHDSGDHFIVVGEVTDFRAVNGRPLLFFNGQYRRLDNDDY